MKINRPTKLLGLIGWPVSHSLSPAMHHAAAAALRLNVKYEVLATEPENLEATLCGLAERGFVGVNVTVPYKQAVMPFLDDIDATAQAIGAVNTILVDSNRLIGFNTDWSGFMADLRNFEIKASGRDCLILGAGGSARAVVYGLLKAKNRVHIFARNMEQAYQLAEDMAPHFAAPYISCWPLSELDKAKATWWVRPDLIVNTTPLGMTPDIESSPWPDNRSLPGTAFVYDLVYNPAETKLIRQAKAAGCQTANGLGMLVSQGAHSFYLWTEQEPDIRVMREALRAPH